MYDEELHSLLSLLTLASHSIMEIAKAFIFSSLSSLFNPSSSSSVDTDWAWLPQNVLFMILNKLLVLSDMVRFGSVCSHWRSVAKSRFQELNLRPNMYFTRNLPILLLPSPENNAIMCSLYSITHREIYDLHMQVPYCKRFCGSSHGWLIIHDDKSFVISLVNPFYFGDSKGIIHLPPFIAALDTSEDTRENLNCERFVSKAILSSDPVTSPSDYSLMLIYGERRMLALWKSGDTHWTYIIWPAPVFCDLIYSQDRFLAANIFGEVYSCDIDVNPPRLSKFCGPVAGNMGDFSRRYIVELPNGTIMQIVRLVRDCVCDKLLPIPITIGFFFYKLLDDNSKRYWVPVWTLVEGALFLGDNCSLYVNASQFPGCQPDSVYFTDEFQVVKTRVLKPFPSYGPYDIGVYHLPYKSVSRFSSPLPELAAPPIWIIPSI